MYVCMYTYASHSNWRGKLVLRNNYRPCNLISHYHVWVISSKNRLRLPDCFSPGGVRRRGTRLGSGHAAADKMSVTEEHNYRTALLDNKMLTSAKHICTLQ